MGRADDIHALESRRVTVGLSSIIGVTAIAGQIGQIIKLFSGGTLEIGVTAGGGWGQGYVMSAGEVIPMDNVGTFYLAASGATCVAMLLNAKSQGYTS